MYDLSVVSRVLDIPPQKVHQRLSSLKPLLRGHALAFTSSNILIDDYALALLQRLGQLLEDGDKFAISNARISEVPTAPDILPRVMLQ